VDFLERNDQVDFLEILCGKCGRVVDFCILF
jgi:hypothetical protein